MDTFEGPGHIEDLHGRRTYDHHFPHVDTLGDQQGRHMSEFAVSVSWRWVVVGLRSTCNPKVYGATS